MLNLTRLLINIIIKIKRAILMLLAMITRFFATQICFTYKFWVIKFRIAALYSNEKAALL